MDCTGREHGSLLNTTYSRFITALSGRLAVIALLCAGWIISPPAWSQTCIEDSGQMECTSPVQGAIGYSIVSSTGVFVLPNSATSDQGVYSAIYDAGSNWCSEMVQSPPYTWTLSQTFFYSINWKTTVQQSGMETTDQCANQTPVSITWDVTRNLPQSCPDATWTPDGTDTATYPTGYCYRPRVQPCQAGQPTQCAGDPIDPVNGNEVEREVDYSGNGGALQFVRTYNYLGTLFGPGTPNGVAGQGWSHTYERRLWASPTGVIRALRQDGTDRFFLPVDGGYQEQGTGIEQLTSTSSGGWVLTDGNDSQETYDSTGTLQTITYRGGLSLSLSYSTSETSPTIAPSAGLLLAVVDTFGHQLSFTYNGLGLIATVTDPNGGVYSYAYSGSLLSSVTFPDSTSRQYLYNESAETGGNSAAYALTGVIDESGTRYATISYSGGSGAVASQLAGGVDSYRISGTSYSASSGGYTYVKDPLGTTRVYNYTAVGSVGKFSGLGTPCPSCADAPANVGYDANGNVSSRTDYNGNKTTYLYDLTRNLETSRTEAAGTSVARTITTQWNPSYRVPALITEPNRTTTLSYDSSGNLLSKTITDATVTPNVSRTWTYTYNTYGQVLTAQGPRTDVNSTRTYTYYSCTSGTQCGQVQTVTDELGHVTTFNTYYAHGQPLTITDPNGVVTTLTYDARERLTSRSKAGETTSLAYYPTGLLKTVTLPDGSFLQYTYDGAHRLTQITDGLGNQIVYTLDGMGNHIADSVYDPSNALALARNRVFNSLDEFYQQVGSAGTAAVTTTFGYDSNGNQTSIGAPLSRNTANQYDALNRLIQITDPGSGVTHFHFDAEDDLTSVVDPRSLTTSYAYDGFGDLIQQTSPDTGITVNSYDSGGNLATSTDARGQAGTYTYDARNRVTQIAYGDQTITFGYDAGTNGVGRLTSGGDAKHALAWSYDALGRVIGKTQTVGTGSSAVAKSVSYTYTNGDLTSLVTPSGQTVTYGYTNGQVTSISVNGNAVLSLVLYQPFGPVAGWTWANNSNEARAYDEDGNVTNVEAAEGFTYSYDNAFRITGITDTDNAALSQSYGYDALDRLTSATGTGLNETWTYDANGNRQTQGGATSSTYTGATASNQLASISGVLTRTYAYAASGQTTSYGGNTFTYMDSGRLGSVSNSGGTTGYIFNALGQRAKKSATSVTLFVYDEAGHLLGEYDGSGNLIEETVWMGDIPVATLQPNGTGVAVYYIHTDHLNTPRRITRPSDNAIVWRWDSEPFGTAAANQNPSGLGTFVYNLRFPGQYYDAETGLNYNYHRDYDPTTGRYVESDPIGLNGGINTYAYTGGNPIGFTDTFGLSKTDRWFGFNNRDFQWWFHNCYKQKGDPDVASKEDMADAYAEYLAAGSPPRGKCSNNKPKSCPVPEPTPAPAPDPSDDNTGNAAKSISALTILYWILSEGSRLFPPRNLVPVP
jgi:RHS repeat-associated protein